ncbi:MAG TPA: hypothetical protein VID27_04625, partial [Blastocatellia bacterium]
SILFIPGAFAMPKQNELPHRLSHLSMLCATKENLLPQRRKVTRRKDRLNGKRKGFSLTPR